MFKKGHRVSIICPFMEEYHVGTVRCVSILPDNVKSVEVEVDNSGYIAYAFEGTSIIRPLTKKLKGIPR